jgi:polar amino acid transport system substrate-binding protein
MHMKQSVTAICQSVLPGFRATATFVTALVLAAALPASATTIDRIKETGQINLGYIAEVRPFTNSASGGTPEGYGVDLCLKVVERVKKQLSLGELKTNWVPVTKDEYLSRVQDGGIDLLCTPINETLARRQDVSFSISVFPGGIRAVIRKDAAVALREALGDTPAPRALWRGSPAAKVLGKKSFGVVAGTTGEAWLASKISSFQIDSKAVPVANYSEGIKKLLDGKIDVFFGDRAVVLGAMDAAASQNLVVLDRLLTFEPYELALARGDDDFRLLVDTTLSEVYEAPAFGEQFYKWFGEYDYKTRLFFEWNIVQP